MNTVKRYMVPIVVLVVLAAFAARPIGSALVYYGHVVTSGYGSATGFDAPYRRLTNGVLESVLNFRNGVLPERRVGLPQVRLYVTEQAQNKLLENIPLSISDWQKARLLYPDGRLRSIKVRHRGDANGMNFVLSKKSWRIKTKKNRLFKNQRVINYIFPQTEDMIEEAVIAQLAEKSGVLAPNVKLVELFVNDRSQGILYETQHLDENFLRSKNLMPVNLYKGEPDRDLPQGLGLNLFHSPSLWRKISLNNRYEEKDRRDIGRFFDFIRMGSSSKDDYDELKNIAPQDVWARFAAFQIMAQSWHNNTDHNQRLVIDDQSGQVSPVLWDTGFSNSFGKDLHFSFDSQPLLNLYLRDSSFLLKKMQYLYKFIIQDKLLSNIVQFIDNISDPFVVSLQRDSGRSAVIPVSSTKNFLLRPRDVPAKHSELKESFGRLNKWISNIVIEKPQASWEPTVHGVTLFIDGKLPVSEVTMELSVPSKKPKRLYLDLDDNGKFDGGDLEVPFFVQDNKITIQAIWLANRVNRLVRPSDYGVFDLHENGLEIVATAFPLVFDTAVKISEVTAQNALTKVAVLLKKEVKKAAGPGRLNRPVIRPPVVLDEVWSGVINIEGAKVINHPVRVKAGTVIELATGASLIFKAKLDVQGRKDNPVTVKPRNYGPWGTFALLGQGAAGSTLKHLHMRGGSGAFHKGVKFMAMFSIHSTTNIQLHGLKLTDNHMEDDMMHIVYGDRISLTDIDIANARSDALDIDISKVNISGGTINRAGNDCLDFMTSNVTVENLTLSNCGDKGVSVGEASQAVVIDSIIKNSNIAVESKDRSEVIVLHSDLLNNRTQANAYKKNWRYSEGGQIRLLKSFLMAPKNNLKTDKGSEIIVDDSAILNDIKSDRRVRIMESVDFSNNRNAQSKTTDTQLFYKIPSDTISKIQGRRGATLR